MNTSTIKHKMCRLVVFTPANKKSAIGRMAALVTRELLSTGCTVTIVRTEAPHLLDTTTHDFGTRIVRWDDEVEVSQLLQNSDTAIYQIGDNYEFHQGGVRWLGEYPGMVCLHDFYLGHLFHGWSQTNRLQAESVLKAWYGDGSVEKFFNHSSSESFIAATSGSMPITEWICTQAHSVITHSQWGCDRVLKACPGPVRVVPLAYNFADTLVNGKNSEQVPEDSENLQILTIGHVNPNKRVSSVITAIGSNSLLKEKVKYHLVGAIQPHVRASLSSLASDLGVTLKISGEVDEQSLAQAISESDVISCLRWPVLEAASASAIEAMLHGKAVIVTNTGFYREIPDTCVIKISPLNESNELQEALESFVSDMDRTRNLGTAAQEWASQTFTASNYAQQVLHVIADMSKIRPALDAIEFFSSQQHEWSKTKPTYSSTSIQSALHIFE